MTFGEKLKQLRESKDMTQDDLAAKLYVSRTAISKWETNRSYPSIDSLKAIQKEFDVSIDNLISEEDVEGSLIARQKDSRKLYWAAISCFAIAVLFSALSVVLYTNDQLPWVVPMRVVACIGVIGYFVFAMASKARYQPQPKAKASWQKYLASRIVVLLIVIAAIVMFIMQTIGGSNG